MKTEYGTVGQSEHFLPIPHLLSFCFCNLGPIPRKSLMVNLDEAMVNVIYMLFI